MALNGIETNTSGEESRQDADPIQAQPMFTPQFTKRKDSLRDSLTRVKAQSSLSDSDLEKYVNEPRPQLSASTPAPN